jgi:hypothetical protein
VSDLLFIDEDFDWWGDAGAAAAVAAPRPRRRPPPRTFASDLRRLRAGFERRSPVSADAAALLGLALLSALTAVLWLSLGGEDAPAPLPTATPAATPSSSSPAPASGAAAAEAVVLESGARGRAVKDLQVALTALGLASGADGDYGAATAGAVAAFQSQRGLVADGVAGPATTAALQETLTERAQEDAAAATAGIDAAEEAGRLDAANAESARKAVAATVEAISAQKPGRAAVLGLALHDVAAVADSYSNRRAALFTELEANVAALAKAPPATEPGSVADGAGVVYRYFPEHGYRFHPLANFAKLNGLVREGDNKGARRLAEALVARGTRSGNALLWEYRFPYGGPEVWTSGFAQAVGAQSLAATGELVGDPQLVDAAAAAFRAIPRDLTLRVGGGRWIQEYSHSGMAILNAQMQSLVSLNEYVEQTGNEDARAYAAALDETTKRLLPSFDTGCWSLYSLDGNPATASYHAYHVRLLESLARRTGDPVYRETADRWRGYQEAGGC